ncbi:acyltransferase [Streptosporangium sp. 'caverna']|uniref:acyltransferase family protein n=1 Tax=Streptosporangium sp. 'caverna' TaxID=2202249 RepID=UPI0013A6B188|nr:acyltransferase [Streptosporangium sp. 'caverna']
MTARSFRTLDGIRGVAAICIVAHHMPQCFGSWLLSAQMAVDLFFVLSGFVLAHVYEPRFRAGMTPLHFLRLRIVRLYPLYLLGTTLGILQAVLMAQYYQGPDIWNWPRILPSLPFAAVMLPAPFDRYLFPFNAVMWSIFFELAANLIWVVFWRRLERTGFLVAVVIGSGALLVVDTFLFKTTAVGMGWNTFLPGFPRVVYSFMLGVLLHRFHGAVTLRRVPPGLLLAAIPVMALLPLGAYGQLFCALVVLPLLVLLGAKSETSGMTRLFCEKTGAASYAVYALHLPALAFFSGLLLIFGLQIEDSPLLGPIFIVLVVVGCVLLADRIETPMRQLLSRLIPEPAPSAVAVDRKGS